MKRILLLLLMLAVGLSFMIYGRGKQETVQEADKVPAEVQKAEKMDSTAMDSAVTDTSIVDSLEIQPDSM